jgi:hypothetical protein
MYCDVAFFYAVALSVFKRVLHTDESVGVESPHDIQWDTSLCNFLHHCDAFTGNKSCTFLFLQESFSLWNGQNWIKGITKGDSILFIYKLNVCNF